MKLLRLSMSPERLRITGGDIHWAHIQLEISKILRNLKLNTNKSLGLKEIKMFIPALPATRDIIQTKQNNDMF